MSFTTQILEYMSAYPGKDVNSEELARYFSWTAYNASSRFANVRQTIQGKELLQPGTKPGAWKYVPTQEEQGKALDHFPEVQEKRDPPKTYVGFEQLMVTIIKECDGEMVVVDDATNIYRMVKVA